MCIFLVYNYTIVLFHTQGQTMEVLVTEHVSKAVHTMQNSPVYLMFLPETIRVSAWARMEHSGILTALAVKQVRSTIVFVGNILN